jgi:hypothetical protein
MAPCALSTSPVQERQLQVFQLTDAAGTNLGEFDSVTQAKGRVPGVTEWRQDESRELGWNGWLSPEPGSSPDFMITFVFRRMSQPEPGLTGMAGQ